MSAAECLILSHHVTLLSRIFCSPCNFQNPSFQCSNLFQMQRCKVEGEYTALCAAGVMSFEDGLKLVKLRGEAMQEAAT